MNAAATVAPPTRVSFEELYRSEVGFVWRTVRFLGVAASDVEDVTHEVFIVVQRRWRAFDPERSRRAWLAGIARRLVMHYRRSMSRAERKKTALQSVPPPSADEPDEIVSRRQAAAVMREFLETLDASRREVFVLIELEGMTAREVSEAVGTNPNTVASQLRAGRQSFERYLSRRSRRENASG